MMIKQRNPNILKHNKTDYETQPKQNPFSRANPYRVKAQFYSQRKKASIDNNNNKNKDSNNNKQRFPLTQRSSSSPHNSQLLKYRRNYKQNPPTINVFQYKHLLLKDNYIQVKNKLLIKNFNSSLQQQLQSQQYRLRLKEYVASKFCASDPYLQIVKDKFGYMNAVNSQFQNVMKMSNLGMSNYTTVYNSSNSSSKNKYSSTNNGSNSKGRMNPFYRKNLLSSINNNNCAEQMIMYNQYHSGSNNNKWEYFPEIPIDSNLTTYNNNNYNHYTSIPTPASTSHYYYNQTDNSNIHHIPTDPSIIKRQPRHSTYSDQQSRISNINQSHQNNDNITSKSIHQSPKSLSASFGPDYQWKNKIKDYIDAVIQYQVDDSRVEIQAKANKEVKIKGKTFYLNHVRRL